MSADRLRKAASKLEKEKIFIGNFEKVEEPKQLGDLYGNQFRIILREIKVNDERSVEDLVNERLSQIRDYGFINYFGMQRFGTGAIPTHELGKSLLQDNVFEVCRLLLAPRENDSERASRARELLKETKDFKTAYKMFPKECTAEKSLLFGLDQFGESAIESAFAKIPRNVRLLYVHAYQSRLWNLAATHRVEKHGYKSPVIGDLVLSRSESQSLSDSSSSKSYEEIVKLVTSENLHLYSIEDVVIPIPGYDAILPENSVKEVIMSCLKDDSLELSSFNHRMRDLRSRGGYRYLIEKPRNLQWELLRYDDSQISLLLSDWEQLNPNCSEPKSLPKGAHLALKLQFELASSSYATILFRELSRSISLDE
jgi:tRNA pseudouridine13 synthase